MVLKYFYPPVNTFNSVFIPHTVWLYTLWYPILYVHWRHLICISWPENGWNVAETCCHEPLICKHLALWVLPLQCRDVKSEIIPFQQITCLADNSSSAVTSWNNRVGWYGVSKVRFSRTTWDSWIYFKITFYRHRPPPPHPNR
jgi:hypothetical protein